MIRIFALPKSSGGARWGVAVAVQGGRAVDDVLASSSSAGAVARDWPADEALRGLGMVREGLRRAVHCTVTDTGVLNGTLNRFPPELVRPEICEIQTKSGRCRRADQRDADPAELSRHLGLS